MLRPAGGLFLGIDFLACPVLFVLHGLENLLGASCHLLLFLLLLWGVVA